MKNFFKKKGNPSSPFQENNNQNYINVNQQPFTENNFYPPQNIPQNYSMPPFVNQFQNENDMYNPQPNINPQENPNFQFNPNFQLNPNLQSFSPDNTSNTIETPDNQEITNFTNLPKKTKKPKKTINKKTILFIILFFLIVASGLVYYFFFYEKLDSTMEVQSAEFGTELLGNALIIRDESIFSQNGVQSIEYISSEGQTVQRGDLLCYVYTTGYNDNEINTLQNYREKIKAYQFSLLENEAAYDQRLTTLNNDILQKSQEIRNIIHGVRGDLSGLEVTLQTAIEARQSYVQNKYDSDLTLNRLLDDETTQLRRIDSWIKQEMANENAIISFYTDGFEYFLTPEKFFDYTPNQVKDMLKGVLPDEEIENRGKTNLYRLVNDTDYAILMLLENNDWNPIVGSQYKLSLNNSSNDVLDVSLLSYTRTGNLLLLQLAVIGDVKDVFYLRSIQAKIGEYVDCLKVPNRAIYEQNDQIGVVLDAANEGKGSFAPVTILKKENGYTFIRPNATNTVVAGDVIRIF